MTTPPTAPAFAVVGRINKGKSSILATLVEETDNARIRVSATPGETTRAQHIPIAINGETLVEFIDTPGFTHAPEALAWLEKHHPKGDATPRLDTVRAFVDANTSDPRFQDECRLLEPVLEGAGIIYIVDASKPFRPDYRAEMEILRWTGRPRMALINNLSEDADFTADWREHLGEYFNLTREFNAHRARFAERIRLLRQLLEIEDDRKPAIERTVQLLETEWDQRRSEAADIILDLIEAALVHRTRRDVSSDHVQRDYQKKKAAEELKTAYISEITKLETARHEQLTELYKHDTTAGLDPASSDESLVDPGDLFAEETWQFLGLTKWQLAVAGAIAGGAGGAVIDVAAGGTALGLPAAIGSVLGLGASLYKGRALANIKIEIPFVPGGKKAAVGGVQLTAGPPRNPNFPWILLDRALSHYHQLLLRAHGRRDPFTIRHESGNRSGFTSKFDHRRRRALQGHFTRLSKGKSPADSDDAYEEIVATLREIEGTSP